ncbi:hypothetical protein [uncultured Eubacterium sp.]|uniref:hypothetical protein n=1 Tax=uncultured Eubacterium sp. TaxID=165185 RepID=UPI002672C25C|nr:hypothetical protein [uncultured Eubacterium sp.]
MSNRKLLYIYYYVNGRKVRNVGFVECKVKEDKCKFNLTLKIPNGYLAEYINIYLYRYGSKKGYKIGTVNPLVENCRYSVTVNKTELEENGFSMEEIAGIYIFSNEYAGCEFRADAEEERQAKYRVQYV